MDAADPYIHCEPPKKKKSFEEIEARLRSSGVTEIRKNRESFRTTATFLSVLSTLTEARSVSNSGAFLQL